MEQTLPSDEFRRSAFLLGMLGCEVSLAMWMFGLGPFALLQPTRPGTYTAAAHLVLPLGAALSVIPILIYRWQKTARDGRWYRRLIFATLCASVALATYSGLQVAINLAWIWSRT